MWTRALIVVVLLACGKKDPAGPTKEQRVAEMKQTLAPIIEKNRAATTSFLAGVRAVGEDAKIAPPVTAAVALPQNTKIDHGTTLKATASWFAGDEKQTPEDIQDKAYLYFNPDMRENLKQLLDTGMWNEEGLYSVSAVEGTFEETTRYAHAMAVRIHNYKPADARGGSFTPASASGDVLLYSMPDGKRLGAFPFEVVQTKDSVSSSDSSHATKELAQAFRDELSKSLNEELMAFAKGTAGAAAPGVAAKANFDGFVEKLNSNYPSWALGKNIIAPATARIEAGPTVVFMTDNVKKLEEHRAELAEFVEETLLTKAEIRIEAR